MKITIDESKFEADVMASVLAVKPAVEHAMAVTFESCVLANFGFIGFERPSEWKPLSPGYARKVHRSFATLELTGAMKQNLKVEGNEVSLVADANAPYATEHEAGIIWKSLPARPVFPMQAGYCMPKTLALVTESAQETIAKELQ